ncbi:hypothetical protein [Mesonia maritima]|uniref:Glycoside-hydrolase family GH114 TIM-barrel domain-containing protein n=1 Tax=Mesonia maritima TaxID=1793873 RepID=A0ABU1K547_9FLAO|nr:hypothetical protein [Mesonia maritima]MDR6300714.1 hypothetical protein [Mesonia maritima]
MILIYIFFVFAILIVAYRYSSKRIEFYGGYQKLWAHRVNDFKKLKASQEKFPGIELDLVYNSNGNWLDIYHPPSKSKNINLRDYIKKIHKNNLGVWLDIKNMDASNSDEIFTEINASLENSFFKKENIIIESPNPYTLEKFHQNGFRTSYYLPQNLSRSNKHEIENIKEFLQKYPFLEISTSYEDYQVLKKYFPTITKNFWILNSSYSIDILKNYKSIREMVNDSTVKTLLTPYNNFNKYF